MGSMMLTLLVSVAGLLVFDLWSAWRIADRGRTAYIYRLILTGALGLGLALGDKALMAVMALAIVGAALMVLRDIFAIVELKPKD